MKKHYPVFGILAPISYFLAVIIGGFLFEGYSHLYNTISELTSSDAPRLPIVQLLFTLYNVALILFGIGLFMYLRIPFKNTSVASFMIILIGVSGISMYFFPQDPRGIEMTFNGIMHIVLASICSFLTMLCMIFFARSFKNNLSFEKFRAYSYLSFVFLFITGGIAAVSVANNSHFGGLFERLTIGGFLQWVFVFSIKLSIINNKYQSKNRTTFL